MSTLFTMSASSAKDGRSGTIPASDFPSVDVKRDVSIDDEYYLVRKGKPSSTEVNALLAGDTKNTPVSKTPEQSKMDSAVVAALSIPRLRMSLSRAGRLLRFGGSKQSDGTHFGTKLYFKYTGSSSAGSAFALSLLLSPSLSAEWSSFQQLFDDYKVVSGKTQYAFASSVASTANANPSYALAYDATYNSTPTSVVALMESDNHQIGLLDASANYPQTSHPSGGVSGFRTFPFTVPKTSVISPSAVTGGVGIVNNLPGSWVDMGDAQATGAGYLKIYFEATTTSVITLTQFVELDVIFRQRT